jgi:hypothetical protein
VEAYPVSAEELVSMNYVKNKCCESQGCFDKMHQSSGRKENLGDDFSLTKRKQLFEEIDDLDRFDLIYFDAFGYRVQPNYGALQYSKKCMMHSKQWRTSYLCCSWCS